MATSVKNRYPITEEYRALAENSPDIIDRFDKRFRHLYINPAGLALLRKSAKEVIGHTIRQTGVPEPFSSLWEKRIRQVFKTGKPFDVTGTFPSPLGMRVYESRLVPEFGEKGTVRYVLVISRDITERNQQAEELRKREAELAEAQRVAKIGSWTYEMRTDSVRWTKELFRIFEVTEDVQPTYTFFVDLIHPDDRAKVKKINDTAIRSGAPFMVEYRITTRFGHLKNIRELGYARKNKTGKVIGLFGTAQDITELKRVEEELRRAYHEMEDRVRDRTAKLRTLASELTQAEARERRRIAYILHEDLQQRLVGIRFRLDMCKQNYRDEKILQDIDWMSGQLVQTIEVSRRLTHRLRPPVLYEFGLLAALEWLAGDMKESTGLSVRVSGREPPRFESEELRAFTFAAVHELLMNVAKHSGVKYASVRLSTAKKNQLEITVSDKGCGFDPASAANHVESFGLFSIRERAEALGGIFVMQSTPGKGAKASLTLPINLPT